MSLELELRAMLRDVVRDVVREEMGARPTELEREFLTYEQAASLVSVSASTIKRWVRAGALSASGKGKLRRVRADDVRQCLKSDATSVERPASFGASVSSILSTVRR